MDNSLANEKKTAPPNETPCLREITRMRGGMGGFLVRKGNGEPS